MYFRRETHSASDVFGCTENPVEKIILRYFNGIGIEFNMTRNYLNGWDTFSARSSSMFRKTTECGIENNDTNAQRCSQWRLNLKATFLSYLLESFFISRHKCEIFVFYVTFTTTVLRQLHVY